MKILETISDMRQEDIHAVCELLAESNKKLEEAMFKLKEYKESESDSRSWRAEGDYRGMGGNYRMSEYPRYEDRRYRDDFRNRY